MYYADVPYGLEDNVCNVFSANSIKILLDKKKIIRFYTVCITHPTDCIKSTQIGPLNVLGVTPLLAHSSICFGPVPGWLSSGRWFLTLIYVCSCPSPCPQSWPPWVYRVMKRDPDTRNSPPLSLALWESAINTVLPIYKLTHFSRNCPKTCDKIWQPWLSIRMHLPFFFVFEHPNPAVVAEV